MKKHLNRKYKCLRLIDSYNYVEEKIEESYEIIDYLVEEDIDINMIIEEL